MSEGYATGVFGRALIVRPRDPAAHWVKLTVLDRSVPVLNAVTVHPDVPCAEVRVGRAGVDIHEATPGALEQQILGTALTVARTVARADGKRAVLEAEASHLADLVAAWYERRTAMATAVR
jgi:hypothetical protein